MSLAILAMLLSAVAVAMHGAMRSYDANDRAAVVNQAARSVLNRMLGEIRTCDWVALDSTASKLILRSPNDAIEMYIEYQLVNGTLWRREVRGDDVQAWALLTSDDEMTVTELRFSYETDRRTVGDDEQTYVKTVLAELSITAGDKTLGVDGSASIRREHEF
jgi:hypothetical protein